VNSAFVADASVGAAWLVGSQSNDATDGLLEDAKTGARVHVPTLWILEVSNTLLMLRRRRRLDETDYQQSLLDLVDLRPHIDEANHRLLLPTISQLAEEHDLSVYDAVYLELALRRELPLASRDGALNKAAKAVGVRTLL
jgi:predicted nucleic acid-binding protein